MSEATKVADAPAAVERKRESHRFNTMDGIPYGTSYCGKTSADEMLAQGARDLGPNADPQCRECWNEYMRRGL